MSTEILVALLSLCGTLLGSLSGVIVSARLTNYRLAQLEEKVQKHNNFAARMPVVEEQIKVINHRISDLKNMEWELNVEKCRKITDIFYWLTAIIMILLIIEAVIKLKFGNMLIHFIIYENFLKDFP